MIKHNIFGSMKKYLLIFMSLIFLSFSKWDGGLSNFCKIEIYSGLFNFGSESLKLTEEGLLCRKTIDKRKTSYVKVKFIPFSKIKFNDMKNLQNYLIDVNFFKSFDSILKKKYISIGSSPSVFVIRETNEKYKIIKDFDFENKQLDSLIKLMNNIIPLKYRKTYALAGLHSAHSTHSASKVSK